MRVNEERGDRERGNKETENEETRREDHKNKIRFHIIVKTGFAFQVK
jgi:hypothetical protein